MIMLCIAYGAKIIFVITGLPLNVPSIRNYLFLLQHIFKWAMVPLYFADLLLAIPSNRNKLGPFKMPLTGQGSCLFWYPSDYSIHQESSLSPSHHPLNTARITLGVLGLPLTIP